MCMLLDDEALLIVLLPLPVLAFDDDRFDVESELVSMGLAIHVCELNH